MGYMTLWGVSLDGVALINLIMCIGFSVDFSAHISYHYLTEEDKGAADRIRGSLYALGIPILQGGGSTIVGVIGLAFAPSYLFVTFFKMIFLVIVLGILHGLVLLPVLLSLFGPSGKVDKSGVQKPVESGHSVNMAYVGERCQNDGHFYKTAHCKKHQVSVISNGISHEPDGKGQSKRRKVKREVKGQENHHHHHRHHHHLRHLKLPPQSYYVAPVQPHQPLSLRSNSTLRSTSSQPQLMLGGSHRAASAAAAAAASSSQSQSLSQEMMFPYSMFRNDEEFVTSSSVSSVEEVKKKVKVTKHHHQGHHHKKTGQVKVKRSSVSSRSESSTGLSSPDNEVKRR